MNTEETEEPQSLASRIRDLVTEMLYTSEELQGLPLDKPPEGSVCIVGIIHDYAFQPDRVVANREKVIALIREICTDEFLKSKGGGWSFLNLCMTRDGRHWGEHYNCEQLYAIAAANGLAGYTLPQKMWSMFPGGMPYMWFDTGDAPCTSSDPSQKTV